MELTQHRKPSGNIRNHFWDSLSEPIGCNAPFPLLKFILAINSTSWIGLSPFYR